MPLKIVVDARHIRDFGIGTYLRNLIQALASIDRGNQYLLVCLPANVREFAALPANFTAAPYPRSDEPLREHALFPLFLRQFRADLVHIPLNRVPLLMPRPYVVTIHDMGNLLFDEGSGLRKELRQTVFRRGLTRASRIIAVSAATRRDVQNVLGIPGSRIRLVYNAPDPQFLTHEHTADARAAGPGGWSFERRRILERYQVNYPFLLYAGNIRPQKNIPRLVEAFAVVRQQLSQHPQYQDLRLIIIGDEISRYPSLRRTVIQSRVEEAVRFLGFVPFDTLRVFYEAATAFVFPSLYEGFGLPPLEAMASGTPVITSGVSSLPEVVNDAAVIVNPENVFDIARGIKEILLDEDLRRELVQKGLEQAARFSWARAAREVLEIYEEVAGGQRS
ncbi:MAG: glycosyltransferase family 4 protein [Bryobacterales bacterium]|nr:glycosyltransferase family 4 protein [Bryobacterales bacterium]